MGEINRWEEKIINLILFNKEHKITEVNNFEFIKGFLFDRENYSSITDIIKQNNLESLKSIAKPTNKTGFFEYMYVVQFIDQSNYKYVATIYDNEELWQDPQIIDIFLLN